MRVLTFDEFLVQPDGVLFQIVHQGKPPGVLMARGGVARYEKIARFVATSLAPDESPNGAAYTWPPMHSAFTFEYDNVDDVRFLVLDRDDVRVLAHLVRSPLESIHAYEHGHVDVARPADWKARHSIHAPATRARAAETTASAARRRNDSGPKRSGT